MINFWVGVTSGVVGEMAVVVFVEIAAGLQASELCVKVAQGPKKQAVACVKAFQSSTTPAVKSPQPAVTTETTSPSIASMSETMAPLSISLNTFTASVTAASAAPRSLVGSVRAMLATSVNAPTISCGKSLIIVGTSLFSIYLTNFSTSSASVSRVLIMLQGISVAYRTNLFDRRMPFSIVLKKY